jgi:hypothetical protein
MRDRRQIMPDKVKLVSEILGSPVDRRHRAVPALARLVTAWPGEALAVEKVCESWIENFGGEPTVFQRGLLEELCLAKFVQSALVAKLGEERAVLDSKGQVSPLVNSIRQFSETCLKIQDRLRAELPSKQSEKTVDVATLWAAALSVQKPDIGNSTAESSDPPQGSDPSVSGDSRGQGTAISTEDGGDR